MDTKVLATLARFAIVAEVLAILAILFMFKSAVKIFVLGDCTMLLEHSTSLHAAAKSVAIYACMLYFRYVMNAH